MIGKLRKTMEPLKNRRARCRAQPVIRRFLFVADVARPLAVGLLVHAFFRAAVLGETALGGVVFAQHMRIARGHVWRGNHAPHRSAALWATRQRRLGELLQYIEMRFTVGATVRDGGVFVDRHESMVEPRQRVFKRSPSLRSCASSG